MLNPQLAWYVAGPLLGLCVVAVRLIFNARLGVTGGYSAIVSRVRGTEPRLDWRAWFVIGVLLGGTLFALAAGGQDFHGYGWLTRSFDDVLVAPILVVSGVLIGYGAKLSGGCTSGNGLSGTSMLSPASLAATGTFFATAIAVSFLTKAVF
jgi:uncharacterized membrane protein YedE/YeeE